jgi:hypothetical protein
MPRGVSAHEAQGHRHGAMGDGGDDSTDDHDAGSGSAFDMVRCLVQFRSCWLKG